jgi:hypothetical protein
MQGFVHLCKSTDMFPLLLSYRYFLHQQVLCKKVLKITHVISIVVQIVN